MEGKPEILSNHGHESLPVTPVCARPHPHPQGLQLSP